MAACERRTTMNRSRMLLVSLAVVLSGCAATGWDAQGGSGPSGEVVPSFSPGAIVFVEGPDEKHGERLLGAFLPAECLEMWPREEAIAAREIVLVGRSSRRGPRGGVRQPPLLNPRPPHDPLHDWRQRPPDPRVVEQARQLYRQRLAEAQERYLNSKGYQDHHAVPIYLGGTRKGQTFRLHTAYHQAITQEFRREWPYGQDPPRPQQLAEVMIRVYSKYPIPQLIGVEP